MAGWLFVQGGGGFDTANWRGKGWGGEVEGRSQHAGTGRNESTSTLLGRGHKLLVRRWRGGSFVLFEQREKFRYCDIVRKIGAEIGGALG